jgi:hypothetical protein
MADIAAQSCAHRAQVGIAPIGCHQVRHEPDSLLCRAEEPLRCLYIADCVLHRIDEVPVVIDCVIQVGPSALDLEVGLVGVPDAKGAVVISSQVKRGWLEQWQ